MKEYFWPPTCIRYRCRGRDSTSPEHADISFFHVRFVVKFWILQILHSDPGRMTNMYWGSMHFVQDSSHLGSPLY